MTEKELIAAVEKFVTARFGGDYELAFKAYDTDGDDELTLSQVVQFLYDADAVRGWFSTAIGRRVMTAMDKNKNGRLSLQELKDAVKKEKK